jgi:two-component system capsular synthesis response regulator RcsB
LAFKTEIYVALVDDHPAVSLGVASVLSDKTGLVVVGQATDSTGLMSLLDESPCHVLISDFSMPGGKYGDGLALIAYLARRYPTLRTVIYTMFDSPILMWAMVRQNVTGIVSKCDSPSHLVNAVRAVCAGQKYYSPVIKELLLNNMQMGEEGRLTPREAEVVRLFCAGGTITGIAGMVHRSVQTISTQKRSAMRKLGVTTDAELIRHVLGNGMATSIDLAGAEGVQP